MILDIKGKQALNVCAYMYVFLINVFVCICVCLGFFLCMFLSCHDLQPMLALQFFIGQ